MTVESANFQACWICAGACNTTQAQQSHSVRGPSVHDGSSVDIHDERRPIAIVKEDPNPSRSQQDRAPTGDRGYGRFNSIALSW